MYLPPLRSRRHGTTCGVLLLAVLVLAFAGSVPPTLAGFDEGIAAYKAGDFKLAYEEFLKMAGQGDAGAQFYLGVTSKNGRGVPQNYEAALWWYWQAADQGLAEAQYNLGVMYDEGQGVKS